MCGKEFGNLWCRVCGCDCAVLAQVWRYAGAPLGCAGAVPAHCRRSYKTTQPPQRHQSGTTIYRIPYHTCNHFSKKIKNGPNPGSRAHFDLFYKRVLYVQRSNAKSGTATTQPNQLYKKYTRGVNRLTSLYQSIKPNSNYGNGITANQFLCAYTEIACP